MLYTKRLIHNLYQDKPFRTTSEDCIVTLADAIRVLAKSVLEDQTVVLEVRRMFVVKDALKEARKAKFCPTKLAKVIMKLDVIHTILDTMYGVNDESINS